MLLQRRKQIVLNNYFPFRKIVYFSNEALNSLLEGDEDMKEFYNEYFLRKLEYNDVWLYLDTHFKPLTLEQEKFIQRVIDTALCKEVV